MKDVIVPLKIPETCSECGLPATQMRQLCARNGAKMRFLAKIHP